MLFKRLIYLYALVLIFCLPSNAQAAVRTVRIEKVESPTFEGREFGNVGAYEKLAGTYCGEIDPLADANSRIVDIDFAPKNKSGKVEYCADFYLLKPIKSKKRTLIYEFGNRGNKYLIGQYSKLSKPWSNNPTTALDAGDGFLMKKGLILTWTGFLGDVKSQNPGTCVSDCLKIQLPIAKNKDGSAISGTTWEECSATGTVNDLWANQDQPYQHCALEYPVAQLDKKNSHLYWRETRAAAPSEILDWQFSDSAGSEIELIGRKFEPGMIYQFSHPAQDPPVMGLGLAAVRDWISFLKESKSDFLNTPNPIWHQVDRAISFGASQTGRVSLEFLRLGMNKRDTVSRAKVFDGMEIHVGSGIPFLNYRFSQPIRGGDLKHESIYYPETAFPFSYEDEKDPFSGRIDGILHECTKSRTCPKIMDTVTSTEYWQYRHSSFTTTPDGKSDAILPKNVRAYLFAGNSHYPNGEQGVCKWQGVANNYFPLSRALFVKLIDWVKNESAPPESLYPKVSDGTLVLPKLVNWEAGQFPFPADQVNRHLVYDYGPEYSKGIISKTLPAETKMEYPVLLPQVGVDGNELAGIRLPVVSVPVANFTGWNLRARANAVGELCGLRGSTFPYAIDGKSKSENDRRPTISELYPSYEIFEKKLKAATDALVKKGYLLSEDSSEVIDEGRHAWPTATASEMQHQ